MRYFISGYGDGKSPVIRMYEDFSLVWEYSGANASWLAQADGLLFAVEECNGSSAVLSFVTDSKDRTQFIQKSRFRIPAGGLCHLEVDSNRNLLFGSCWDDGTFFVLPYCSDGTFGALKYCEKQDDGTSRKSRCHCVKLYDKYAFVMNIELDKVFCYCLDREEIQEVSHLSFPLGVGPRHALINKEKSIMYVITEYSSELFTKDISNPMNMKIVDTLSILPWSFRGCSTGSTLAISADKKHLYAANRGADTIAHFFLDKYGFPVPANDFIRKGFNRSVLDSGIVPDKITQPSCAYFHSGEQPKKAFEIALFREAEQTACTGITPRHIALLDGDKYLAVALQNSDKVVFFKRDAASGTLSPEPVQEVSFEVPTFVVEAKFESFCP